MASFNDRIIATLRANKGVVGGHWQDKTLILLHHTGRRSGRQYVTPALAAPDGTTIWRDNWPEAREYERMTDRQFPVVRLRFRSSL
jgi:hypothetical protein